MPEAGFSREPVHHDLKSLEGGWVKLRRLPYDDILKKREMGTKLSMTAVERRKRGGHRLTQKDENKIGIEVMQSITREYEFANCITDHNLTVDNVPVDFSQPKLAFKVVDPHILQEIELLLQELNMETDEEELEDFTTAQKQSSSDDETPKSGSESSLLENAHSG